MERSDQNQAMPLLSFKGYPSYSNRNPSSHGGLQTPYKLPLQAPVPSTFTFYCLLSGSPLLPATMASLMLLKQSTSGSSLPWLLLPRVHTACLLILQITHFCLCSGVSLLTRPSLATPCKIAPPPLLSCSLQHFSPDYMLHMFYFYLFIKRSIRAVTWPHSWLCART